MENYKVPWSGRGHKYTDEEIAVVTQAMQDADPLTQGRYQNEFEKKISEKFQLGSSFAVTSCAAALELAAILCKLKPGDEVIVPAHTFAVSAIPFARNGAKIVWADIDAETWVVSAKTIKPLITPKTKAVVVVHLYGLTAEMDPIMALARENNLLVIEDVAQAMGATYKGKPAGSFGDFSCFSFHGAKNITTLGEGGVLAVKNPELASVVPGFRHNGMRSFTGDRSIYWQPTGTNVDFDWSGQWPYNFCVGEVQCALGSKLLDRLETLNCDHKRRTEKFQTAVKDFSELHFQKIPQDSTSNYHLLPTRYDGSAFGKNRDDFMKMMAFEHKVRVNVQYYPLYRYDMFKRAGFGQANCPNTDFYYDNMVSFPFQHWMSDDQFDYMIEATQKTLRHLRG